MSSSWLRRRTFVRLSVHMTLSLTLRNHTSEVSRLVDRLEAFGAEAGLPPDVTFRLTLSLDEIVSNVIRHGFADQRRASDRW